MRIVLHIEFWWKQISEYYPNIFVRASFQRMHSETNTWIESMYPYLLYHPKRKQLHAKHTQQWLDQKQMKQNQTITRKAKTEWL